LLHVDAGFGEPPEMVFRQLGVHDVESFVPPVKALFDERAKHPVLLVHAVEKSANVTVLAKNAPAQLTEPPFVPMSYLPPLRACVRAERMQASKSSSSKACSGNHDAGRERPLPNAFIRIRRDQDGRNGLS
jgi:hypothetical protein